MIERRADSSFPVNPSEQRGRIRAIISTARRWIERRLPESLPKRVVRKYYDEIMRYGYVLTSRVGHALVPEIVNYIAYFTSDEGGKVYRAQISVCDGVEAEKGLRVEQVNFQISDEETDDVERRRIATLSAIRTTRMSGAKMCPFGIDDSGLIKQSIGVRRGNWYGKRVAGHEATDFLRELLSARMNEQKTREYKEMEEMIKDHSLISIQWISSAQEPS